MNTEEAQRTIAGLSDPRDRSEAVTVIVAREGELTRATLVGAESDVLEHASHMRMKGYALDSFTEREDGTAMAVLHTAD
jgi:hypothetical protein